MIAIIVTMLETCDLSGSGLERRRRHKRPSLRENYGTRLNFSAFTYLRPPSSSGLIPIRESAPSGPSTEFLFSDESQSVELLTSCPAAECHGDLSAVSSPCCGGHAQSINSHVISNSDHS